MSNIGLTLASHSSIVNRQSVLPLGQRFIVLLDEPLVAGRSLVVVGVEVFFLLEQPGKVTSEIELHLMEQVYRFFEAGHFFRIAIVTGALHAPQAFNDLIQVWPLRGIAVEEAAELLCVAESLLQFTPQLTIVLSPVGADPDRRPGGIAGQPPHVPIRRTALRVGLALTLLPSPSLRIALLLPLL